MVNFSPLARTILVGVAALLGAVATALPSPWSVVAVALVTGLAAVGIVPPHVEAVK